MQSIGSALVLPAGSVPKVILSGDTLDIQLKFYSAKDSWTACVVYPDGHQKHHMVFDVIGLLDQITGQLKTRYNILSFEFKSVPQALQPSTITIGEIKYA